MITNSTQQRSLRGHLATRPTPRAANTAEHQAALAWRLTARDRWILHMLHEHRVLTSHQLTTLAFPSFRSGRQRLRELYQWGVLDRFQPFITHGTAPMHYVLAPAGAAVLAATHGLELKHLGYRRGRALDIAHSLRLAHTIGVNDWFTALIRHTQQHPGHTVTAWWSETRCTHHFGDLTRPDAYGRYTNHTHQLEFFLEYDLGTEPLTKLTDKLAGYAALAEATTITTPLLIWLPTARREAAARPHLHATWTDLPSPETVPVATAAADQLDPTNADSSPADAVWLPLTPIPRADLAARQTPLTLLSHWPSLRRPPATPTGEATEHPATQHPVLPPPYPMPPPNTRPTAKS